VLRTLVPTLRQLPDLPAATRREIVEAIEGNLARLEWSINSRLMAAKLDSGVVELHPRPLDLASSIRQVVAHIASWLALKHQGVSIQAAPDLPLVWADPSQLEYAITNLLVNATKFAPADSTIVVTLQPMLHQPDEQVMQVCVEDEGPGVPPAQRQRIFEKFHAHTTRQPNDGAGLGLYMCREVVGRHGGRIWVEDRPGGGSRFCLILPLVAEEAVTVEHADKERAHAEGRLQDPGD
jgi:signal transduction histidine kinase